MWKKTFVSVFAVCFSFVCHADTPRFDSYTIGAKTNTTATLKLAKPQDKMYRTLLTQAAKNPVNFAGHYVLKAFGCGAECIQVAIINKSTGNVVWVPHFVSGWIDDNATEETNQEPIAFQANSRLLKVRGRFDEHGKIISRYYEIKDDRLSLVSEG